MQKMQNTQNVWFYEEFGPKEVLKLGRFPVPVPKRNQLLVQVRAAALNPIDVRWRQFTKFTPCFPVIPGCDMAGVVIDKGVGVSRFNIGDEVYGNIQDLEYIKQLGTLAELIVVEEHLVAMKPKNLSFEEAASFPMAFQTAIEGFRRAGDRQGMSVCVFVVGGAGGVGSLAVQLAKHVFRASLVVATTSAIKVNFVKSLGADMVVDYTKTQYEDILDKFDLVFDTVGDSKKSYIVAKKSGTVIDITWPPSNPKATYITLKVSGHILEMLKPYLECGIVKPVLDPAGPYHFTNAPQAFEFLETGRARGKVVISCFPSQPMAFFL